MSIFDDPENYAPFGGAPRSARQREKDRRLAERLEREARLDNPADAKDEVIQKAVTAGCLLGVALISRWQVVRAFQALGYSKRDARVLTTGLSGAAFVVAVGVEQGREYRTRCQEMSK